MADTILNCSSSNGFLAYLLSANTICLLTFRTGSFVSRTKGVKYSAPSVGMPDLIDISLSDVAIYPYNLIICQVLCLGIHCKFHSGL